MGTRFDRDLGRLYVRFFVCLVGVVSWSCSGEDDAVSTSPQSPSGAPIRLSDWHGEVLGSVLDYLAKRENLTAVVIGKETVSPPVSDWREPRWSLREALLKEMNVSPEVIRKYRELGASNALIETHIRTRCVHQVLPVSDLETDEGHVRWEMIGKGVPETKAILRFCIPVLDSKRSSAVVQVWVAKGPLSTSRQLFVLEKADERWIVRDVIILAYP